METNRLVPDLVSEPASSSLFWDMSLVEDAVFMHLHELTGNRLVHFNRKTGELLGSRQDAVPDPFFLHMGEAERTELMAQLAHLRQGDRKTVEADLRVAHQNGTMRLLRTTFRLAGTPPATLLLGISTDITPASPLTRAGREDFLLAEAERTFGYGTWEWIMEKDEVIWSEGLIHLFGYSPSEFGPRVRNAAFFLGHVHPEDQAFVGECLRKSLDTQSFIPFENRIRTGDGRERWMYTEGRVLERGEHTRIIGTLRDTTQEKAVKERMLHQEVLLSDSERIFNHGVWVWEAGAAHITWSEGIFHLFDLDAGEFPEGKVPLDFYLDFAHPQEADRVRRLGEGMADGMFPEFEHRAVTRRGREIVVSTRGRAVTHRGRLVRIVGITSDVTLVRGYEENIRQKIQELNRSNAELEQFAYVASHDLQEPLRKITMFGRLLEKQFGAGLEGEGRQYLERMMNASHRMQALITSLLSLSRIGRTADGFAAVNLHTLVSDLLPDFEYSIIQKQARLELGPLPVVWGVPSQLSQVFANLVGNALKFSRPGVPPVVRISSRPVGMAEKAACGLQPALAYAAVQVDDNGIGFDPEDAERIFVVFQRLHGRMDYEGNGIGLAICKRIVENHKGGIQAESRAGGGASFTLRLPIPS